MVPGPAGRLASKNEPGEPDPGRGSRFARHHIPGVYAFSCWYADGRSQPEIVLAVGPNLDWEFFGIATKTVITIAAGLAVLFGSGGAVAAVVVIVIAVKRRQSKQAQSSELTYLC